MHMLAWSCCTFDMAGSKLQCAGLILLMSPNTAACTGSHVLKYHASSVFSPMTRQIIHFVLCLAAALAATAGSRAAVGARHKADAGPCHKGNGNQQTMMRFEPPVTGAGQDSPGAHGSHCLTSGLSGRTKSSVPECAVSGGASLPSCTIFDLPCVQMVAVALP